MTLEQFKEKWDDVILENLSEEDYRKFIEDSFSMYEETGFIDTFDTPFESHEKYKWMAFRVLRRATEEDCDLEAMPMWCVQFENGDTGYCYPEEICIIEQ